MPDTDYLTAQQMRDRLTALANQARNQSFCSMVSLLATARGTPINCMRVAKLSAEGTGKDVLIIGGVHAREWVPPSAIVRFAEELLEAYHTAGRGITLGGYTVDHAAIVEIVDNEVLYFYPMANPDGYEYSRTFVPAGATWQQKFPHIMWRKNRPADPPAGQDDLCTGVDLNRNFDICWDRRWFVHDSDTDASADPCQEPYAGPSANSEPETRNIERMVNDFNAKWFVDCHMRGQYILYPWGIDATQTDTPAQSFHHSNPLAPGAPRGPMDGASGTAFAQYMDPAHKTIFETVSARMVDAIRRAAGVTFEPQPISRISEGGGTSADWAYSRHILFPERAPVFAFGLEVGHGDAMQGQDGTQPGPNLPGGFFPVFGNAEYVRVERELWSALLALLLYVHQPRASGCGCCPFGSMLVGPALLPLLDVLRELRDVALRETPLGRRFIDGVQRIYRAISPATVRFLERHDRVRRFTAEAVLRPAILALRKIHTLTSRFGTPALRVNALLAAIVAPPLLLAAAIVAIAATLVI